jgi:hypothetical protein
LVHSGVILARAAENRVLNNFLSLITRLSLYVS